MLSHSRASEAERAGGASDRGAGTLRRSERANGAGIGLIFHAWTVFWQKPITESDIQREMERGGGTEPPVA